MLDLTQPILREQLAKRIHAEIDAWAVKTYNEGPRKHLGASLIGRECSRELWYGFRWAKHKVHEGRQYRLFQRGHREESYFIELLEGIGCEVTAFNFDADMRLLFHPESDSYLWEVKEKISDTTALQCVDVTDIQEHIDKATLAEVYPDWPQLRIEDCGGHFGGSMDAKVTLPKEWGIPDGVVFVNEFKTNGNSKKFTAMTIEGVQASKYEHFCQMSIYGYKLGLQYGLYMMVNKPDDNLHVEVIKLDWELAKRLLAKADKIITSQQPPPKIAETITFRTCSYCDMNAICHKGAEYDRNCRSCMYAQPVANKEWFCHGFKANIPADFIAKGCQHWKAAV